MKIYLVIASVLFLAPLFGVLTEAVPTCTFRSSCNGDETCIFSVFQENDSHVGSCNYYSNKVCCTELAATTFRSSCDSTEHILVSVFQENDSHVGTRSYYSTKVCGRFSSDAAMGTVRTSCQASEGCLVSVFQENDSHVGSCNYYSNKVCISKVVNATVTINLNNTQPSWNEPLRVSGKATKADGTNLDTDANGVNVYVNNSLTCQSETDSNGDYTCDFRAPNALGNYLLNVTVTDPATGKVWNNFTAFTVKPIIGSSEEKTAKNIACYEEPRVVQNPDGTLVIATVRICVWK